MSHCVSPPPDDSKSPRREAPSLIHNGREPADVVTAFLDDWFGPRISVRTLRTVAEAMVDDLIDHDFVIMPIDSIESWADHFRRDA